MRVPYDSNFEFMSEHYIYDQFTCLIQIDRKSTAKVDYLKEVEAQIQKRWAENKAFESDAVLVRMVTFS